MSSLAPLPRFAALALLALGLLASLHGDQAAPDIRKLTGPAVAVPDAYFGMHVHRLLASTPWPDVEFGTLRLWDTRTTWRDLEPQRNQWRFNTLDRLVALAAEHRVEVLLCFGKTPLWASSIQPQGENDKRVEAGAPADLEDWRNMIQTVALRYKGKIKAYEVWNEANVRGYYLGDVHTMVEMTRIAAETIHSVDPDALVVSPSATDFDGLPWFGNFLAQGGARYVDVIGYHLYVTPAAPEKIPVLASAVHSLMLQNSVHLPMWDTETGWTTPKQFSSDDEAAAYVARSLLLAWVSGVSRFYWYAWDNRNWVTLNLTTGDDYHPTPAAQGFQVMKTWMLGQQIRDCGRGVDGTWVCHSTRDGQSSLILWNPDRRTRFALPPPVGKNLAWKITDLRGNTQQVQSGGVFADAQPLLLSH